MIPYATTSPLEALAWIRNEQPFDIAILDMQMPEIDGLMLSQNIRELRNSQELPIIMLTSLGYKDDKDEFSRLEIVRFLSKPIKQSQLYNVLIEVIMGTPQKIKKES